MNNIQKRFLLFLLVCMGTRSLLVYCAKTLDPKYLPILGYLALVPAIGFMYIYLTSSRKTGGEVFGEKIWWDNLRPIHSLLYFVFAYSAIHKKRDSWYFLAIDVIIGFLSFVIYHYSIGNFSKL